ncbi:MAG: hypothetical protein ACTSP4_07545 [Candidatus Hodarchaeales archaeon]
MSLTETVNQIAVLFQREGFKCEFNQAGADLVAKKGGFKKKVYLVIVGANEFDAGLALYRLRDDKKASKILFLQEGDPSGVRSSDPRLQIVKDIKNIVIT